MDANSIIRDANKFLEGWPNLPADKTLDEKRDELVAMLVQARRDGMEAAAKMLETSGVLLPIIPGETKADHVVRFANAFAAKIRAAKEDL